MDLLTSNWGGNPTLFLVLLGVVVVFALAIYKKTHRSGPGATDSYTPAPAPQPELAPPDAVQVEDRTEFLSKLNEVDRGLTGFYRYFLYLVFTLVTGFAVFFFWQISTDASRHFLFLYFGVLYLAFVLWFLGQLHKLKKRASRSRSPVVSKVATQHEPGVFRYSFQIGNPEMEAKPGMNPVQARISFQTKGTVSTAQLVVVGIALTIVFTAALSAFFFLQAAGR